MIIDIGPKFYSALWPVYDPPPPHPPTHTHTHPPFHSDLDFKVTVFFLFIWMTSSSSGQLSCLAHAHPPFHSDLEFKVTVFFLFIWLTSSSSGELSCLAAGLVFDWIFIKLADKGGRHKVLDKYDFRAVWTIGMIVTYPWVSFSLGKCCADDSSFILMGKWCLHARAFIFDQITIKAAGNQDRHQSSGKFDLGLWFPWPNILLRCLKTRDISNQLGTFEKTNKGCLFVFRFYGPVNPIGSCRARSIYLTTHLLGRLSPLSG